MTAIRATINGEEREVPEGLSVADLLSHLGMKLDRVAIERNREILPRALWKDTTVEQGDRFEIVQFVGGG
jgi:thiamine biosynthesis protein ThiS